MAATAPTLRRALQGRSPSLQLERELWDAGHEVVVGMDEVGRGAWAGPLTLGAVVLPRDRRVYKVRDSKTLTPAEREALFDRIAAWCWSIAAASILAKVPRDRLMLAEADHYPWWWFDDNKGYPCPRHKAVLRGLGPSAIHRRSWVFMDGVPFGGGPPLIPPDPQGTLSECPAQPFLGSREFDLFLKFFPRPRGGGGGGSAAVRRRPERWGEPGGGRV